MLIAIDDKSAAKCAGLNVGDVIMSVNGKLVNTHQEAIREVDGSSSETLVLSVWGLQPSIRAALFKQQVHSTFSASIVAL